MKLSLLPLMLMLTACVTTITKPATHESLIKANLPELITLKDLINTEKNTHSYKISPDGKRLAWIGMTTNGTFRYPTIFYKDIDKNNTKRLEIWANNFSWMPDNRHLYRRAGYANEVTELELIDLRNPSDDPVTIFQQANTQIWVEDILRDDPKHIIVRHNGRDTRTFDLYRLNIKSQETTLLSQNNTTITDWVIDHSKPGGVLLAEVIHGKKIQLVDSKEIILEVNDFENIKSATYDHTLNTMWVITNANRDKKALIKLDLQTLEQTTINENEKVDISFYDYDHNYNPTLVTSYPDYQQIDVLDESYQEMVAKFKTHDAIHMYINSSDTAKNLFIIQQTTSKGSELFLYNKALNTAQSLDKSDSLSHANSLANMKPIQFTSRDGLTINGYLTTPAGVTAKKLPMVLLVHGGPFSRDYWGKNSEVQLLANRGYAVLQVNYRGSKGYGKEFLKAAFGEFSGKMHDDLIDGVDWMIEQGTADPDKIAIMGASYGGYATLVGMTQTPEKFNCGIDIFGMSDLELMADNFPEHWASGKGLWVNFIGEFDDKNAREIMKTKSPINYVKNVTKPILVIQGTRDIRVIPEQSTRFVKKMKELGKDVQYWEMSGVGHSYGNSDNRKKLTRKVDHFLAQCLGGQSAG